MYYENVLKVNININMKELKLITIVSDPVIIIVQLRMHAYLLRFNANHCTGAVNSEKTIYSIIYLRL